MNNSFAVTLAKSVVAGLVMLACVFATAVVVANSRFASNYHYEAVFADSSGLRPGEEVRIAGVRVGDVDDVALFGVSQVLAKFSVDRNRELFVGTRAIVRWKNLTGDHFLELTDGPGPSTRLVPGGRLPISQTAGSLNLNTLLAGFRPLFRALDAQQVNQLSGELVAVLQGQSGTVDDLLAQVGSLTGALADRDQLIGAVITNLNDAVGEFDGRDEQLSALVTRLQELVSGLASDRHAIGRSLEGINGLAGTTADLLKQARPPLTADIRQLGRLSGLLDDNSSTLQLVLDKLPAAYRQLKGIGSYGSFFNFYMCNIRVAYSGPDGTTMTSPTFSSSAQRCEAQ